MQIQNSYWWFKSALSENDCQSIIDLGTKDIRRNKESGFDVAGTTFGENHKQAVSSDFISQEDKTNEEIKDNKTFIRDSEVSFLDHNWLYDMITPYVHEANVKAGWNYDIDFHETPQFTVYNSPGGFYGWHNDGGSDHHSKYRRYVPGFTDNTRQYTKNHNWIGKIRKLSMTINLSEPGSYEGGNLKFDYGPHAVGERYSECTEIRPRGSVIVFPSYLYHQITPVTRGTRYSLVLWSLGNPFK